MAERRPVVLVNGAMTELPTGDTLPDTGGGGSPGGATGEIQFNNSGAFAGAPGVLIEDGQLRLPVITAPPVPAAGGFKVFGQAVAERLLPAIRGPNGLDTSLQPFLGRNKVRCFSAAGGSTSLTTAFGVALTATGTPTARNPAATSAFARANRLGFVSAATAGALAGVRTNANLITTGDGGSPALGGFHLITRFGVSAFTADARMFVGIGNLAAPTNVEPSTLIQSVGVGFGAADSNLRIFYGGTAAQAPIDLGALFPAKTANIDLYELTLFAPPSQTGVVHYRVERRNTGNVVSGTLSGGAAVVPASNQMRAALQAFITNNATAAAVGLDLVSFYCESDY